MNDSIKELENLITLNLQTANNLKNEIEKKVNEKHDLLIEISKGIIETLDTFDKVDEYLIEKGMDKNEDSVKTKNRYNSVKTKLLNLLQKYGITKIEFPDNIHEWIFYFSPTVTRWTCSNIFCPIFFPGQYSGWEWAVYVGIWV